MNFLDEKLISQITCIKIFPEYNELKIYFHDDHENYSFNNSDEYDQFLNYLRKVLK